MKRKTSQMDQMVSFGAAFYARFWGLSCIQPNQTKRCKSFGNFIKFIENKGPPYRTRPRPNHMWFSSSVLHHRGRNWSFLCSAVLWLILFSSFRFYIERTASILANQELVNRSLAVGCYWPNWRGQFGSKPKPTCT